MFYSINELIKKAHESRREAWELVLIDDANERNVSQKESFEKMKFMWQAMKNSVKAYDPELVSLSGLSGKNGGKMQKYIDSCLCGEFMGKVMSTAISVAESNACMKCIVAAPTAGSCGVLPAVLVPFAEKYHTDDDTIIKSLYLSAVFGQVIAHRASIAGAEGGCQAEIGSASAMAAATLVYLRGGTIEQSANACAFALKSLLGLVCDPVAGLVEVPCVKRNVIGAVNAITSSDMAMAGIASAIPVDEVIDAMKAVGDAMPYTLKETGEGGLADTPTGRKFADALPGILTRQCD